MLRSEAASVSDKVVRNTSYNALARLWFLLVGIVLTPYIVGKLGVERFAVWALVAVITNYFALFDFGVGSSFVKFIAEFHARQEQDQINKLLSTGLFFYLLFGLAVIVASVLFLDPLVSFLKIPAYLHSEARFVFLLGIVIFSLSNAAGVFITVLPGLQRMDLTNKITVLSSLFTIAGTFVFLERGWGLPGLMINNAIVLVVSIILQAAAAYKLLPYLQLIPRNIDRAMFRRIFSFGFKVQISRISGTVTAQTDKILISYFLAVGLVSYYQLSSTVVNAVISVPLLLVSALIPAFSEIEARGERRKLIESYLRTTKYLAFFTVALFVFTAVSAGRIIFVWMGTGFQESVRIIPILAGAFLLNMLARVSAALCMAMEKPQEMMSSSLVMIFSNILLSIMFIKFWGFPGVAWGTFVSVNIGTLYFLWKLHRDIGVDARAYARSVWPFCLAAVCAAAAGWLGNRALMLLALPGTRFWQMAVLFFDALVFFLVYGFLLIGARVFDLNDRDFVRDKFPWLPWRLIRV